MKKVKEYFDALKQAALFKDIATADFEKMFSCLGAEIKNVDKAETILFTGDNPCFVGIVLSGQFHIVREDYDGNNTLIAVASPGEIFAESLCCAGIEESPVTVFAAENATVMLIKFNRILHTCSHLCAFHEKLIENMLKLIAKKNLFLQSRMEIMAIKSVRDKVLRYLESFTLQQGRSIVIPLNREGMANYLCVERSALSYELSKMKKDGLIDYRKNHFVLK